MVRLIHRDTGDSFWVHESRLEEYFEKGHRLPSPPTMPPEPEAVSDPDTVPAAGSRKRGRAKPAK